MCFLACDAQMLHKYESVSMTSTKGKHRQEVLKQRTMPSTSPGKIGKASQRRWHMIMPNT